MPPSTRPAPSGCGRCCTAAPRDFGQPTSVWTLELAAEVASPRASPATRQRRDDPRDPGPAGVPLEAGQATGSPAPTRRTPKKKAPRPPDPPGRAPPGLGCWASRTRSGGAGWPSPPCTPGPSGHAAAAGRAGGAARRPRPQGAGLLRAAGASPRQRTPEAIWLRFVDGRPVSAVTTHFLAWCCERAGGAGSRRCCWSGTTPPGTSAGEVRALDPRAQPPGQAGRAGVRIVACPLPIKSPWLNPIEPKWVHGKRRVVEPARLLTARELADRVCAAFGCPAAITRPSPRGRLIMH